MAIVENKASEIGDVILIKASVPIVGLVTLSSFTDSVVNETSTKYFHKDFRYSVDGINFTTWRELTNNNIAAVDVSPTATFIIEYRYIRSGVDASNPDLEFDEVELSGDFAQVECGESYRNSIFAKFFTCTDLCVLSWMINVLEKIYKEGILPKYIDRGGQSNDSDQDKDFVEFWKTISQYFAYVVCYARQWEVSRSTSNYDILIEYLRNQTFFFCGQESIEELRYVMNNTYDEMRKRGTYEIIKTKGQDGRKINGEWHRLFCHLGKCSDWYFSYTFNYKIGWVGDSASPLYKGNYNDPGLTKGYEESKNVSDLNLYPLLNDNGSISIVSDLDNTGLDISVMSISSVLAGQYAGIGNEATQVSLDKLIKVSKNCEYEITFMVKQSNGSLNSLSFSVDTYDEGGNLLSPQGTKLSTLNSVSSEFFNKVNFPRTDKYYQVRGVIYSVGYSLTEGDLDGNKTSSPSKNLRFSRNTVCYISPKIILDNTDNSVTSNTINLYDIKVRHLRTSYSTGFEQPSNFIKMKVQNFNLSSTTAKLERQMREYLLPYNSTYKMEYINDQTESLFEFSQFDFLVAKYIWFNQQDLDTRTGLRGTGDSQIDAGDTAQDNYVGWALPPTIGEYLVFGQDNVGVSGTEQVLIKFNKLKEDYPSKSSFKADLRAFWFNQNNKSGKLEFKIETYKGGSMESDGSTGFVNIGGDLVDEVSYDTILTLDGDQIQATGVQKINSIGELLGVVTYNSITGGASLAED
jgi:hypothetical protein